MIWKRLQKMQCPKCNRVLERNAKMTGYKCVCGFFVTNGKFEAIVNKLYEQEMRPGPDNVDKNLEELNNL